MLPEAAQEAHDAMEELFGNPSSAHISGLRARYILESTRDLVREVLAAEGGQIVFTSGATEAIQMGIFSTLCDIREHRSQSQENEGPRTLLYGATEHKAVPQALQHWNQLLGVNNQILEIPVDQNGALDLEFLRSHAANADLIHDGSERNGIVTDLKAVEKTIRAENTSFDVGRQCSGGRENCT